MRKGLLNGLIAWGIGIGLWLVAAFAIAFWTAFDLGRQGSDAATISGRIGRTIPVMYAGNRVLTVGLIVVTALAVAWRARSLAGGAKAGAVITGLITGAVAAALMVLLFLGFGSFGWPGIAAVLAYLAAGASGGALGRGIGATG